MLQGKQVLWFLIPILIAFIIAYQFEQKFNAKYLAKTSGNSGLADSNEDREISTEQAVELTKRQLQ